MKMTKDLFDKCKLILIVMILFENVSSQVEGKLEKKKIP